MYAPPHTSGMRERIRGVRHRIHGAQAQVNQGAFMYAPAHTRSKQERGTERRRKALKVPERARKKRACARKHLDASGVQKPLPQEVRMTLCSALR